MAELKCDECEELFKRKSSLLRHQRNFHVAAKQTHTCVECNKSFSRKDLLQRHTQKHNGNGTAACRICCRPFRKDYLAQHIRTCKRRVKRRIKKRLVDARLRSDSEHGYSDYDSDQEAKMEKPQTQYRVRWHQPEGVSTPSQPPKSRISNRRVQQPFRLVVDDASTALPFTEEFVMDLMQAVYRDDVFTFTARLTELLDLGFTISDVDDLLKTRSIDRIDDLAMAKDLDDTLLLKACKEGAEEIVDVLLDLGADVNRLARYGWSPLHLATLYGYKGIVATLLRRGVEIDAVIQSKRTALHFAARLATPDCVRLLLAAGASVDGLSASKSPLGEACDFGELDNALLLLKHGADPNIADSTEPSPLEYALKRGWATLVAALLEAGGQIDLVAPECLEDLRTTAVEDLSSYNGRYEAASDKLRLLERYSQRHNHESSESATRMTALVADETTLTPQHSLHTDAHETHEAKDQREEEEILPSLGDKVQLAVQHLRNRDMTSFVKLVQSHCERKSTISAIAVAFESQYHALLPALAYRDDSSGVRTLLGLGWDVNERGAFRRTALYTACCFRKAKIVSALLEFAPDLEAIDDDGDTALAGIASTSMARDSAPETVQIVQALLNAGANTNNANRRWSLSNPLHSICNYGYGDSELENVQEQIIELLILHGADVNLCNVGGGAPLGSALHLCSARAVEMLLKAGAVVNDGSLYDLSKASSYVKDSKAKLRLLDEFRGRALAQKQSMRPNLPHMPA